MIEITKIGREISELSLRLDNESKDMKRTEKNKVNKKIQFLRHVMAYLNSFPSEQFVTSEISRLSKRRQLIADSYSAWIPSKYFEKDKDKLKEYEKENGIPKLKIQLKALKFILDK